MTKVNFENLPAPMGFAIDIQKASLSDYEQEGVDEGSPPQVRKLFGSENLDITYGEFPPGATLPWHTHEPHSAALHWVIEGEVKISYKDNDGEAHSYVANGTDEELIYEPAGAHNTMENIGDTFLRTLTIKDGRAVVGRLEHIVGDAEEHYDPRDDQLRLPLLDMLPRRGHIFHLDEDAVTEW